MGLDGVGRAISISAGASVWSISASKKMWSESSAAIGSRVFWAGASAAGGIIAAGASTVAAEGVVICAQAAKPDVVGEALCATGAPPAWPSAEPRRLHAALCGGRPEKRIAHHRRAYRGCRLLCGKASRLGLLRKRPLQVWRDIGLGHHTPGGRADACGLSACQTLRIPSTSGAGCMGCGAGPMSPVPPSAIEASQAACSACWRASSRRSL